MWRVLALCLAACSASERPDTLGDPCTSNEDCRAPFACLESRLDDTAASRLTCTLPCSSTDECPDWEADDCEDDFTSSRCLRGVCVVVACEG